MKLIDLVSPDMDGDVAPLVTSEHPDVQELLCRFHANQEMDCPALDSGHVEFIGVIYMEVVHNACYRPTPEILEFIRSLNAKMRQCSPTIRAN